MIRLERLLLIPAGDQGLAGRRVAAEAGRLVLIDEGPGGGRCWVAADDAELIETPDCGTYLRLGGPGRIEGAGETVTVEAGLYQVVRRA
ncbi:MAG TPA: hypothetical protein VFD49_20590 [Candidatus Dormibacteraeota bacterium]|nr:hypothetical protein [Candidatus Dormibacteraeota bacterium]